MTIRISSSAKKYIAGRGVSVVALKYLELQTSGLVGVCKEVTVEFGPPKDSRAYWMAHAEDIQVWVDRRLIIEGDVVIKKQGFWKLASLYVEGIRIPF